MSIMLLLALTLSSQMMGVPVSVQGPAPGAASCVIVAPSTDAPGSWTSRPLTDGRWTCGRDEMLQCNADGFEPLDVPATACTAGRLTVRLTKGAPAQLTLQGDAQVEWRSVGARGTQLLATRTLAGRSTVIVAEPRVLRVVRPQRAPISLVVHPGDRITVPAGVAGGELFGRVLGKVVRPERVHFTGPTTDTVVVSRDGFFASPALIPGTYRVQAEYRGGIRSEPVTAQVTASRTVEGFGLGIQDAGGVTLVAGPDLCAPGHTLMVIDEQAGSRGVTNFNYRLRHRLPDQGCEVTLDGLRPGGNYRASIHGAEMVVVGMDDLKATRVLTVTADQRSIVPLSLQSNTLTGTVYAGEQPLSNARLALVPFGQTGSGRYGTTTDAEGRYTFSVEQPGRYVLKHEVSMMVYGAETPATVSGIDTRFDWRLPATRLTITFESADGPLPTEAGVLLVLDGPSGIGAGGTVNLARGERSIAFVGLPLGRYSARAFSGDVQSTAPLALELTPSQSEARGTLRLERATRVSMRVTGPDGVMLPTANVRGGAARPGGGVFDITGPPGTSLIVTAPGFVPRCVVLQRTHRPEFTVSLTQASPHTASIRFSPGLEGASAPGLVLGLPGSDCPVPAAMFTERTRRDEQGVTVVTFGDLPAGEYRYTPNVRYPPQPLMVPGPELGFVRKPRQPPQ